MLGIALAYETSNLRKRDLKFNFYALLWNHVRRKEKRKTKTHSFGWQVDGTLRIFFSRILHPIKRVHLLKLVDRLGIVLSLYKHSNQPGDPIVHLAGFG